MSRKGKTVETESRLVVAWEWRVGLGLDCKWTEGSFWGGRNVVTLECDER